MRLMFDWKQDPHRRFNPLTQEWVLVSPHRTERPWQGQVETTAAPASPEYDPECYLCPGNKRADSIDAARLIGLSVTMLVAGPGPAGSIEQPASAASRRS